MCVRYSEVCKRKRKDRPEIPYFLEQSQLNDQGNEQSSQTQLCYIYNPAPCTIYRVKNRNFAACQRQKSNMLKKCDFQKRAGSNSYMFHKVEKHVFLHSTDVCEYLSN